MPPPKIKLYFVKIFLCYSILLLNSYISFKMCTKSGWTVIGHSGINMGIAFNKSLL